MIASADFPTPTPKLSKEPKLLEFPGELAPNKPHYLAMSSPTYSHTTPKEDVSPRGGVEPRDDEWSGEEDAEADADVDAGGRPRKRPRTSRPMSVSCELCKQRKVKCDNSSPCSNCVKREHIQLCDYKPSRKNGSIDLSASRKRAHSFSDSRDGRKERGEEIESRL